MLNNPQAFPAFLPPRCSISWDDFLVQGRARVDRELLDAEAVAGDRTRDAPIWIR
jgi:hypothetical protein